jgi:hypothetical protein
VTNFIREALGASLFLYALLLFAGRADAERLVGLPWASTADIEGIQARLLQVRFVANRIVVVEADTSIAERERLFVDEAGPNESYYLADHVPFPLPQGMEMVYASAGSWALVRMDRQRALELRVEAGYFLWPLPERYSLKSWIQRRPGRKSAFQEPAEAVRLLVAQVDAGRLQRDVKALVLKDTAANSESENFRNRFALHPELLESTEYIRGQLAAVLGENAVELQPFPISRHLASTRVNENEEALDTVDSTAFNVVGTLPGSDPQAGYYVICAHYDATAVRTRGWDWRNDPAPGADDNASGVALMLESARVLAAQSFPWSIRFIAFSGEELGTLGSRFYAEQAQLRDEQVLGVLNFDMIGFNDLKDRLELVTNPGSLWLVDEMRAVNERYDIGLDIDVLEDGGAGLSDHAPFWARGYDAILGIENYLPIDPSTRGVIDGEYRINSQYHSVRDAPDSLNFDLIRRTTQLAVATLAQYAVGTGLPNLAVFAGDLRGGDQDQLRVRISNIGLGSLQGGFAVRVSQCAADSSACELVYEGQGQGPIAPGAGAELSFPWSRFGEMIFLVEVDTPEDEVATADNRSFQAVSLLPQQDIAVFPNPFQPLRDGALRFSGVPLNATVRLYASTGELLWSAREDDLRQRRLGARGNEILWLGVNGAGANDVGSALVGSGVYIYTIHSVAGELLKKDKIAVVR